MYAKVVGNLTLGGAMKGLKVTVCCRLGCKELYHFPELSTLMCISDSSPLVALGESHVLTSSSVEGSFYLRSILK